MILEHARFTIHPGQEAAFEAAYRRLRGTLLRAPGCGSAQLLRSVEHEGVYLLRVEWDTLAHHTEHFPESEQGKKVIVTFAPFLAAADVNHFDAQTL